MKYMWLVRGMTLQREDEYERCSCQNPKDASFLGNNALKRILLSPCEWGTPP